MNKQDAIKRIASDLCAFGWHFVPFRDAEKHHFHGPHTCHEYTTQDQAATRENPCLDGTILCALACIGMRSTSLPDVRR